jgi:hypothetical protein
VTLILKITEIFAETLDRLKLMTRIKTRSASYKGGFDVKTLKVFIHHVEKVFDERKFTSMKLHYSPFFPASVVADPRWADVLFVLMARPVPRVTVMWLPGYPLARGMGYLRGTLGILYPCKL